MNTNQRNFILANAKPGDIIYITGKDWIANVIAFGQEDLDKTWTAKLSHAVFLGDDNKMIEASITINGFKYVSGIHITPLSDWENDGKEDAYIIIQRLTGITPDQIEKASQVGRDLQKQGVTYPLAEVFGTLIAYANYNFAGLFKGIMGASKVQNWQNEILSRNNPLDEKNNRYCIATVNHCFETGAGIRIIPTDINESICFVGDGLRNKDLDYTLFVPTKEDPTQFFTYHKLAGEVFSPTLDHNYNG